MDTIQNPASLAAIRKLQRLAISAHNKARDARELANEIEAEHKAFPVERLSQMSRTEQRALKALRERMAHEADVAEAAAVKADLLVNITRQALSNAEGVTFTTVADAHS